MMRVLYVFLLIPLNHFAQEKPLYDGELYENVVAFKKIIQIENLEVDSVIDISNKNTGLVDTLYWTQFKGCELQLYKSSYDNRCFIIKLRGSNPDILNLIYPKYKEITKITWKEHGKSDQDLQIYCEGFVLSISRDEGTYSFKLEDTFIL